MSETSMKDLTGKPHQFFSREIYRNDPSLRRYIDIQWAELKAQMSKEAEKESEYREQGPGLAMNSFQQSYNMFSFYNEQMHDVLMLVRDMVVEACDYYNIDYKKEKYYITSWLNYVKGPRKVFLDQLKLDDHGSNPKEFHGYYAINAEPGVTWYKLDDGELSPHHNKNGKAILSLNGYHHAIGDWDSTDPRITVAYNIMPLSRVPRDRNRFGQHIPLL